MDTIDALTIFNNPWLATENGLDEAEETAKAIMKRDIADVPDEEWNGTEVYYRCPNCKRMIGLLSEYERIMPMFNYCPDCGQHLDLEWMQEEEDDAD